jgi:hypothetical protein
MPGKGLPMPWQRNAILRLVSIAEYPDAGLTVVSALCLEGKEILVLERYKINI